MGTLAVQVALGKVCNRFEGAGCTFLISTDGVTVVLPGVSGLGGATRWG